jgi:3-methyladenine DNA glycosylase AlkD
MRSELPREPKALCSDIIAQLVALSNPENVEGMARYGITPENALGVTMPVVKRLASEAKRELGRDGALRHELAQALWDTRWREARLCAAFIEDPKQVTPAQMDAWVSEFDSWDICDGVCTHLFDRTPEAWDKAIAWSARPEEYVKRAGFVVVVGLAVHDKRAADDRFSAFLPVIERECTDERNFVKKAVNWTLRAIGKRTPALNGEAVACARRVLERHASSASARWIARGALRELESRAVRERLGLPT